MPSGYVKNMWSEIETNKKTQKVTNSLPVLHLPLFLPLKEHRTLEPSPNERRSKTFPAKANSSHSKFVAEHDYISTSHKQELSTVLFSKAYLQYTRNRYMLL